MSAARTRIAGWGLALLAVGNGLVVVGLWGVDGARDMHDTAGVLTGLGRVTGLLGAYLALVQLLLLARLPVLDRLVGLHRLTAWHRAGGFAVLGLLVAHTLLITAGYTVGDNISLGAEIDRLITGYPGVITATAGLVALIGVTVTSIVIVRRRLSYETWYFVHLYAYLGIVLAFSHQLATGSDFVGDSLARAYWYALYIATFGAIVGFRIALPVVRSLRHRLRVASVSDEGPGVVSVEIGGVALERLRARTGQFFTWRFLTRERWFQAHPFSLSAAPDPSRLRITVKGVGDFSTSLRTLQPGTRVIVEGPFGSFTAATRRRARVALIAGGIGITPIRALLEDMPGEPGDIAVVYRAIGPDDVVLRHELDELAGRRGIELHYVLGDHRTSEFLGPERLQELIPDIAARDVYVCGPPAMTEATRASLDRSGVPRRHVFTERFAL